MPGVGLHIDTTAHFYGLYIVYIWWSSSRWPVMYIYYLFIIFWPVYFV